MTSAQNIIKYLGLAIIAFFLIKAFANDKISNTNIGIIVIALMVLVIILTNQTECFKQVEKFGTIEKNESESDSDTDPPYGPFSPYASIIPGTYNLHNGNISSRAYENYRETVAREVGEKQLENPTQPKIFSITERPPSYIDATDNSNDNADDLNDLNNINELTEPSTKSHNNKKFWQHTKINKANDYEKNFDPDSAADTLMPPKYWYSVYKRPPICIPESHCPVCPIATDGVCKYKQY